MPRLHHRRVASGLGRTKSSTERASSRRRGLARMFEPLERRELLSAALDPIANQNLPLGKTLLVPLTGSGGALQYSVSSDNAAISAQILTGDTFLKLSTSQGDMVFELFNSLTPKTVGKITGLVNADFYNGLTFHRVIPNFMIQGGDPNGDGTGGPGFTFDDEFNANAIFSGNGQLAMANSGPDTNGSQFFITADSTRYLDFNHTIFGQLIRGFDVRDRIINVPTDPSDKPRTPVTINSATIINDTTDAVLLLTSTGTSPVDGGIMVTVSDGSVSAQQHFTASAVSDDANPDPPFLNPIDPVSTTPGTPVTINLSSTNIQGGQVDYAYGGLDPSQGTVTLNGTQLTVTPAAGFTGTLNISVGVAADRDIQTVLGNSATGYYRARGSRRTQVTSTAQAQQNVSPQPLYDTQTIAITVQQAAVTSIGSVDLVRLDQVTGWAFNQNSGSDAINVRVDIDGRQGTAFAAKNARPDLTGYVGSANHGFTFYLPALSVGTHTIKVYAIDPQSAEPMLLGQGQVTSANALFDEHYYLTRYPDIAQAVANGAFASGWQHYVTYGQFEGRDPSAFFDEATYLRANPDVAQAVQAGALTSGFMHFTQYGQKEGRPGLPYFNEKYYLETYPDIAQAVAHHALDSGFEHFMLYGAAEGRSPIPSFSASYYVAHNPDIAAVIHGTAFRSAYEHFILFGQYEDRTYSPDFNETIYLQKNPDIAAAVANHAFRTGLQHYLLFGQYEGRPTV